MSVTVVESKVLVIQTLSAQLSIAWAAYGLFLSRSSRDSLQRPVVLCNLQRNESFLTYYVVKL